MPLATVSPLRSQFRIAAPVAPAPLAPDGESDAELVAAMQRGEARAATRFFDRHAPRVERLLGRVLGPSSDLGDALNETFCRAFDRLDRIDRPEGVSSWLCRIAVMVAREELRGRRRRRWLEFFAPESLPEPAVNHEDPFNDGDDKEALARVFELLDTLSDDDRLVFALRHLEGFELTEVAQSSGVSLASVKRHLARAERRFYTRCARDPLLASWSAKMNEGESP